MLQSRTITFVRIIEQAYEYTGFRENYKTPWYRDFKIYLQNYIGRYEAYG